MVKEVLLLNIQLGQAERHDTRSKHNFMRKFGGLIVSNKYFYS